MDMTYNKKRAGLNTLFLSVIYIAVGLLLAIWPESSLKIIIGILGGAICVLGLVKILQYFKQDTMTGILSQTFSTGLSFVLIGAFVINKSGWVSGFLTVVFGCLLLLGAVSKLQVSIDLKRLKFKLWYLPLIGSLLSATFAVVILMNTFDTTIVFTRFIGLAIVIEGLLIAMSSIYLEKQFKRAFNNFR